MSIARLAEFGRMDRPPSTEAVHIRHPHGNVLQRQRDKLHDDFVSLHMSLMVILRLHGCRCDFILCTTVCPQST